MAVIITAKMENMAVLDAQLHNIKNVAMAIAVEVCAGYQPAQELIDEFDKEMTVLCITASKGLSEILKKDAGHG